jgi:hypothetical protein
MPAGIFIDRICTSSQPLSNPDAGGYFRKPDFTIFVLNRLFFSRRNTKARNSHETGYDAGGDSFYHFYISLYVDLTASGMWRAG